MSSQDGRAGAGRALFLTPALAVFALFFAAPLGYFFVVSFWRVSLFQMAPDLQLGNYAAAWHDYLYPLVFTIGLAFLIATVTTAYAFAIAHLIRFRGGRFGSLLLVVALITMFGGYLVKIYAWRTILGLNGILNTALGELGLIEAPLTWLLFNPGAVAVTLVHFLLPFAILPIFGALRSLRDEPLEAGRDLGAGGWRVLVDIVLPQCRSGLAVAFALSFLLAAGDYVTPRLVGGPHTAMVGSFIESQFVTRLNAPQGAALSFSVLAGCLAVLAVTFALAGRLLRPR